MAVEKVDFDWFPMYWRRFHTGTKKFKTEEIGAYLLLLIEQWNKGCVPVQEDEIAEIAGVPFKKLSRVMKKFQRDDQGYKNDTLEQIRSEQISKKEKRSESARKAGEASAAKRTNVERTLTTVERTSTNKNKKENKNIEEEGEGKELAPAFSNPDLHEKTQENEIRPRLDHPLETEKSSGEKIAGRKNEVDKANLSVSSPNAIHHAAFWRERLNENQRMARRRAIIGKFPKATPQQIEMIDVNYDPYWDNRYPNGSNSMDYSRCFNWYVSDQKDLPKDAAGTKLSYSLSNKNREELT